jgi:hypothetical protein
MPLSKSKSVCPRSWKTTKLLMNSNLPNMTGKFCQSSQSQFLKFNKNAQIFQTRLNKHQIYCKESKLSCQILLVLNWRVKLTRLLRISTAWYPRLITILLNSRLNYRVLKINLLAMKTTLRLLIHNFKRKKKLLTNTKSKKDKFKFWTISSKILNLNLTRVIAAYILPKNSNLYLKYQKRKIRSMKIAKKAAMKSNRLNGLIFQSLIFLNGLKYGTMESFNSRRTHMILIATMIHLQLRESG